MFTRNKTTQEYIDKGIKYIVDNNILPGESVYIDDEFAGFYILNLTDYDYYSNRASRGIFIDVNITTDHLLGSEIVKYYSCRTVFSTEFGTFNQILVMNASNDDLVWINV